MVDLERPRRHVVVDVEPGERLRIRVVDLAAEPSSGISRSLDRHGVVRQFDRIDDRANLPVPDLECG